MRDLSIRFKMVVGVLLVFALGSAALLLALPDRFRNDVDVSAKSAMADSARAFGYLQQRDTTMLSAVLDSVMSRPDLRVAMAKGDRAALQELATPLYRDLKSQYGITHMYFIDPNGVVILRVHKPEQNGDKLTRVTFKKAQETESYGSGLELGKTAFALRVVHPLYAPETTVGGATLPSAARGLIDPAEKGKLVGYVEVGEEIDHFYSIMKAQTGDEFGLLLAKDRLDQKAWGDFRKQQGAKNDWDERKNYVLASTTSKEWSKEMDFTGSAANIPDSGVVTGVFTREAGRTEIGGVFPVIDAVGRKVGAVFVIHDLSPIAASLRTTQMRAAAVAAAMAVLMAVVVVVLLNILVFNRLDAMSRSMEHTSLRLAGGDFDVQAEIGDANDEIGRFERFYSQFVRTIADTLKHALASKKGRSA